MSNLKTWQERAKVLKEQKEAAEKNWEEAADSIEPTDRCGLENGRYGQAGIQIIDSTGRPWGIQYHAITSAIFWFDPCSLEFFFDSTYEDKGKLKSGAFKVTIIGAEGDIAKREMQKIQMRLASHKREQLHCSNKEVIREIRIELMPEDDEED